MTHDTVTAEVRRAAMVRKALEPRAPRSSAYRQACLREIDRRDIEELRRMLWLSLRRVW